MAAVYANRLRALHHSRPHHAHHLHHHSIARQSVQARRMIGMRNADFGLKKREGRKQKAEGSKSVSLAHCLLPTAFCFLLF